MTARTGEILGRIRSSLERFCAAFVWARAAVRQRASAACTRAKVLASRASARWDRARERLARVPVLGRFGPSIFLWLVVMALPFWLLHWTMPFRGTQTFGNDYPVWCSAPQLQIFWSISQGTFPLYMPGFAVGHSTAAMTLAQIYHPAAWLSYAMPGYWKGDALEWNTFYRFLQLGLTHGILYTLSRRLSVPRVGAFLGSLVAVYNLRMLDSFRYGASLESYSAMLLLVAACGYVWFDPDSKWKKVFVAITTYLLVVSGNPQWAYLGALVAACLALLFPWIERALNPALEPPSARRVARYLFSIGVSGVAGLVLTAPYLLTFYREVLKTNQTRAHATYEFTLGYGDTVEGTLANFLMPMHADVHGQFGGSALFLLAALFPLARLTRKRVPKVFWWLYGMLVITLLFAVGKYGWRDGAVHRFIFDHVPGFAVFRVPGRITLWIPVLAFPLWLWLFQPRNRDALKLVSLGALVIYASKWFWSAKGVPAVEWSTPMKIAAKKWSATIDDKILLLAGITLLLLLLASHWRKLAPLALAGAVLTASISTRTAMRNGTWKQNRVPTVTEESLTKHRKTSASAYNVAGEAIEVGAVTEYTKRKLRTSRPIGSIEHDAEKSPRGEAFYQRLVETKQKVLLVPSPEPTSDEMVGEHDTVKLTYNTSNRHEFDVFAARDGYFVLGLPLITGFTAKIDGEPRPVTRANGLYAAVFLPRGAHKVELQFTSWPFFIGMAITFGVTWLGILYLAWSRLRTARSRIVFAAVFLLSGVATYAVWNRWLYGGPSIGTAFTWEAKASEPPPDAPDDDPTSNENPLEKGSAPP